LLLKDDGKSSAAGDTSGVKDKDMIPCTPRRADVAQHRLEAWTVIVFPALNCI
jgi:hypothetical protein